MNLLTPDLSGAPGTRVVVNSLYPSNDPGFLTEDLLLVELPGGAHIDVSWFPEHDPSGAYVVTVFRGPEVIREQEAGTAQEAVRLVQELAGEFSAPVRRVS
jgi:hypothetical protein